MSHIHPIAKNGFRLSTKAYAQARPSYPQGMVEHISSFFVGKPRESINVLDIGAGTGIMTRLLVDQKFKVTAVDPVDSMLDVLRQSLPAVTALKGNSRFIPLPSESQDFIMLAQCFHWFDDIPSLEEMHRVLKPNGYIFMAWNTEARNRSEWISKIAKLWEGYESAIPCHHEKHWQKIFETDRAQSLYHLPIHHKQWHMDVPVTCSHLWTRIMSKSYVVVLDDDKKKKLREDFDSIMTEYGLAQKEPFLFLDNSDLYWCQKK